MTGRTSRLSLTESGATSSTMWTASMSEVGSASVGRRPSCISLLPADKPIVGRSAATCALNRQFAVRLSQSNLEHADRIPLRPARSPHLVSPPCTVQGTSEKPYARLQTSETLQQLIAHPHLPRPSAALQYIEVGIGQDNKMGEVLLLSTLIAKAENERPIKYKYCFLLRRVALENTVC